MTIKRDSRLVTVEILPFADDTIMVEKEVEKNLKDHSELSQK